MQVYNFQREFILSPDTFNITNKSRQIGFTSGAISPKALNGVLDGIDQLIVSSSQRQSNKVMSYIEVYLDTVLKKRGLKLSKDTQTQKTFPNGKSIYCFPSKPETVRGFPGSVYLDEFSLHKDDEKIFEAMLPSITSNEKYKLAICSTPLGCSNMFYRIFSNEKNNYPDFIRNTITCYEAIKQGCKMNLEIIKRNFDEESFRQEYLCEFVDESTSFFSYELLKSCIEDYENIKGVSNIGVDVGRTSDKTGIATVTEAKEIYYLSDLQVLSNTNFDTQKFIIKQTYQDFSANGLLIDKGAIGYQIAEELEKELTNATGVFTNQVNFMSDVVTFTKKLMEQGKFKFHEDRDLINDFHKIKKTITAQNNTSFKIERDKTGHGDRAISVMLALYGFKNVSQPGIFWV